MSYNIGIDDEFDNFMCRAIEIEKVVKKLASNDTKEQKEGMEIADLILEGRKKDSNFSITENETLGVTKFNKTLINNQSSDYDSNNPSSMKPEMFMKMMEEDSNQRAKERRIQNKLADKYKKIGNTAFNDSDYDKAIINYGKAIEHRKDSGIIWNNRGLAFMKKELYEKALEDFDKTLRIHDSKDMKALLNSSKCHTILGNSKKSDEFITLAKKNFPMYLKYISDFENELKENSTNIMSK